VENLFGGDGKNIWEKPGVKMIWGGGGNFSPSLPKKYAVGERNLLLLAVLGNYIHSPKLSQESSVLLSESSYFN